MIRLKIFFVCIFVASLLSAQITERDIRQSRSAFAEGVRKGVDNDFAGAHELFNKAILLDSLYSEAYLYRGLARIELEMFEEAIEDFRRIINLDRDISYQANYFCGIALLAIDRFREALIHFNEAVRLSPGFSSFFHRGKAFFYLENYEQALQDFEVSGRLSPDLPEVQYYIGKTHAMQGDYDAAMENLTLAMDHFSGNPEFHYFYGSVLMQLDRMDEAAIHLDIAEKVFGTRQKPLSHNQNDTMNAVLDDEEPDQQTKTLVFDPDVLPHTEIQGESELTELLKGFYDVAFQPVDPRGMGVQVASFTTMDDLQENAAQYQKRFGHPVIIEVAEVNNQLRYRIIIGIFDSRDEALVLRSQLRDQGFLDSFIVRYP